jgi:hypothetical protein
MIHIERLQAHLKTLGQVSKRRVMTDTQTERGSCRFTVQQVEGGKQAIVVQTFHDSIGPLRHATLGFNLLSGTTSEQAKKMAEMLNEYVLEAFLTISDSHPMFKK